MMGYSISLATSAKRLTSESITIVFVRYVFFSAFTGFSYSSQDSRSLRFIAPGSDSVSTILRLLVSVFLWSRWDTEYSADQKGLARCRKHPRDLRLNHVVPSIHKKAAAHGCRNCKDFHASCPWV